MDILIKLFNLIASVNVGDFYPLQLTLFTSGTTFVGIIVAYFYKPFRNVDKTKLLSAIFALYLLCAVKITCDYFFGLPLDGEIVIASLCFAFVTLVEFYTFCCLKNRRKHKKMTDNQLIDGYYGNIKDNFNAVRQLSSPQNPFKRAEFLPTFKQAEDESAEVEINYSYLLKWVNKIYEYPLDLDETNLLKDFEFDVKKYSLKKPSNYEINDFSTKLNKIIKIASKYDGVKFDAV